MKLIKPKAELLLQQPGLEGVYKQIELAGRTCYRSMDKITEDSAKPFVDRMIKSGHCYTGDSEVFTNKGWIKWVDYKDEDIAVINSNREFVGYEKPQNIIQYKYSGKFYEYPELGIKVTDKHTMFGVFRDSKHNFYKDFNYNKFTCDTAYKDNNGREKTLGERTFKVPTNCIKPTLTDPFYELVGFWLGDGCYNSSTVNKLTFHLKKQRKIDYLKDLCIKCNYIFEVKESNFYKVVNPNIGTLFNSKYYNQKGKTISEELTPIQIHSVIQGLINSDGGIGTNTKTITFTNTSKDIIDWLLRYAPLAGYNITNCGVCKYVDSKNPVYKVLFKTTQYIINNDSRKKDKKVIITLENNIDVYCVTVSTGLILVRGTNGQTSICGNCAMLEHGTVYLKIPVLDRTSYRIDSYIENPYSKARIGSMKTNPIYYYVTTNLRVLVEHNWMDDLQYICEPTEYHEKRYTFRLIISISVTRELNRHRVNSIAEQSTRYCNYSKDKFGGEVTFCIPQWIDEEELSKIGPYKRVIRKKDASSTEIWITSLLNAEEDYLELINQGWQPQHAREVLPLCTATEIIHTAYASDWRHFFDLRYFGKTGAPHPNMIELTSLMAKEADKYGIWNELCTENVEMAN